MIKNKTTAITALLLACAVFASGCASAKIQPRPRPVVETAASVNFYRSSQFLYSLQPAIVALDSIESVSLQQNSKSSILLSPGEHALSIRSRILLQKQLKTSVTAQPNQALYYEIYPNPILLPWSLIPISHYLISPFLVRTIDESSFKKQSNGYNEQEVPYLETNNTFQQGNPAGAELSPH